MKTIHSNGLVFWDRDSIRLRRSFEEHIISALEKNLTEQNKAWSFHQIEAPILTPKELISPSYTTEDMFFTSDSLALRPETTQGSYLYAQDLLKAQKIRMPLVVYQHGKSFRREQNRPLSSMKLLEFYQLEFQCIYAESTMNDYSKSLIPAIKQSLSELIGPCSSEPSDRLPEYSLSTTDIICRDMEVCSISIRKDFPSAKVLEVAIGTDRLIYQFLRKREEIQTLSETE